jgi:two-component system KDP operon response regulator KdpE
MSEHRPLVLVVEDEPEMRALLRVALEAHGYRTLPVATAGQALREAFSNAPDLVLLDLGLPDGDGREVTRRIREWSSVPILVVSVRSTEEMKIEALDAGADDYITKPFGAGELMARVRAALRKNRDTNASVFHIGRDVRVDLDRRIVTVRGKEVHFTPVEFKLLTALVRNAGRVVPHQELLNQVWGPDPQPVETLRVFMTHLRHKLERQPGRPKHLLTETGVGYRLRVDP